MRFFVLPIFHGVRMDGHPIFSPVSTTIKILDAMTLSKMGKKKKKKKILSFILILRIVLSLHFIGRIYWSKILLHHFIGFI